jgi:gamma-glutamyltranspeptidase/glutathione hydrolase
MKRLACLLFAAAVLLPAQEVATSGLRLRAERPMVAQPQRAPKAMVATVHEAATDAALAILRKGGNAVDAAVAIAFVLGVVHPEAGNLGGSGYLMVRMADGREVVFDYGGNSPAAARPGIYTDRANQRTGYKSIAVPGTPAGMGLAHAKLGKLKWSDCLEPARKLAADGFPASQRLELILPLEVPLMKAYPDSAKVFLHGSDQPLKQGEIVIQKDLAVTIRRLQKQGWKEFYTGETARRIAADMAANGGLITMEDLAAYEARETKPLRVDYRGHPVLITPPSSSGGTALAVMLNTLSQFDLKVAMEGSAAARHLQVEAMRVGFGARGRLMAGATLDSLLAPEYAQQAAGKISIDRATPAAPVEASSESLDTTHFTVADPFGNVVTNTYTLSSFFGSKVVIRGTGVLMNNHMSAFVDRDFAPRQRYSSTMTPVILLRPDGTTWAAFGTPGAMTIPSTLMQIVTNLVDFKMSLRDAIEFPRVHAAGPFVDAEPAALVFDAAEKLRSMGHRLSPNLRSQGDVNAVLIEEGGWRQGWADGRRGGVVKGF